MQWVSLTAMTRIDRSAKLLARSRHASRRDLVGLMIMYLAPEDPAELWKIAEPYLLANRRARGKGGHQALMAKLPSPVSLRLDALVACARTRGTIYRQEVIGALAVSSLPKRDRLLELYDRYYEAAAGEAEVSAMEELDVLRREPPRPGRRRSASA